jgi:putative FmdB family regulatory protein
MRNLALFELPRHQRFFRAASLYRIQDCKECTPRGSFWFRLPTFSRAFLRGSHILGVMPLFDFRCRSCGREFEALVRAADRPWCPSCKSAKLEQLPSMFTVSSLENPAFSGRVEAPPLMSWSQRARLCSLTASTNTSKSSVAMGLFAKRPTHSVVNNVECPKLLFNLSAAVTCALRPNNLVHVPCQTDSLCWALPQISSQGSIPTNDANLSVPRQVGAGDCA